MFIFFFFFLYSCMYNYYYRKILDIPIQISLHNKSVNGFSVRSAILYNPKTRIHMELLFKHLNVNELRARGHVI